MRSFLVLMYRRRGMWSWTAISCENGLICAGQIVELGGAIRQLRQAGMDSAAGPLPITRKRAELEGLMQRDNDTLQPFPLTRTGFVGSLIFATAEKREPGHEDLPMTRTADPQIRPGQFAQIRSRHSPTSWRNIPRARARIFPAWL